MWTGASFTPGSPVNDSPIRPDSPSPNSVSASPVATWLVTSVWVRKPNTSDVATPAPSPATMPTAADPEVYAAAKPHTAPITIIPSTPRLSTPERSTTNSPMAASSRGVAAVMIVSRTASKLRHRERSVQEPARPRPKRRARSRRPGPWERGRPARMDNRGPAAHCGRDARAPGDTARKAWLDREVDDASLTPVRISFAPTPLILSPLRYCRLRADPPDPVPDQGVAGEDEEQQHSLEDLRRLVRDARAPPAPPRRRGS